MEKTRNIKLNQIYLSHRGIVWVPFSFAIVIFLWYAVVRIGDLQAFILPPPDLVWRRFLRSLQSGDLLYHFQITLWEVLGGLSLGLISATTLGYLLAKSRRLEQLLTPLIVASQSVPVVAIAPLLVIWFGSGMTSKMLISALIVFFPILINTIVGVRSVPEDLHDLMRSLQATRWQTFKKLEAPAAMPVFLGGLRIGATLSVIGAVVGEFVSANRGLGFLILTSDQTYDTAMVFVVVFSLVGMALTLYSLVVWLENRLLGWQSRQENRIIQG